MNISTTKAGVAPISKQSDAQHPARQSAYRFIFVQALLGLAWVLVCALFMAPAALSALLGVAIAVIANGYFARKVFAFRASSRFAKKMVGSFYRAQAMKMMITAVMFALCFAFVPVCAGAFFAGYILVQLSVWLSPLFLR